MINMDLETTEPCTSLGMITLDTVRPYLELNRDGTGERRWVQTVVSLMTLSPREIATWFISSSAEGCYPMDSTDEEVLVARRITHELDMVRMAGDPVAPAAPYSAAVRSWMKYAFDGDELVLQKDDKEEIISGDQLRELMQELFERTASLEMSLHDHAVKFYNVDAWFSNNHDLIAEEAWEHDWLEILYG
tara:strand:+ start:2039 stop:2608 length:570 start_codon:yes stop_codon:yes gene_type:complete